jgi:hypothetical protein
MFMTQQTVPIVILCLVSQWWFGAQTAAASSFFLYMAASVMTMVAPNPSAVKHTPFTQSLIMAVVVFVTYTWISTLSPVYVLPMAVVSSLWDMAWFITREQVLLKTAAVWSLRLLEWYYVCENDGQWVQITFIVPLGWCLVLYAYNAIFATQK